MHITLRPNEKIYINGAVLRVDRKVSLELMNDAVFLLEAHVMVEKHATTPLRRLYFIVQLMLIEPQDIAPKKMMFNYQGLVAANAYPEAVAIQAGLATVSDLVTRNKAFEALKVIRNLLPAEDAIMAAAAPDGAAAPVHLPVSKTVDPVGASAAPTRLRLPMPAAAPPPSRPMPQRLSIAG